jgi:hypothetical protein
MRAARLVNVIACRSYALVFAALTVMYLAGGGIALYRAALGPSSTLFGHAVHIGPYLRPEILSAFALGVLACGVISSVLATLAWDRSLVAVSVAFALWSLVSAASIATARGGIAHHPIATIGTAVLALLLAAAIATRRTDLADDTWKRATHAQSQP